MRDMNIATSSSSIPMAQKAFRIFLVVSLGIHMAALFYQKKTLLFSPAIQSLNMEKSLKVQLKVRKEKPLEKPAPLQKKIVKKKPLKEKSRKKVRPIKKEEIVKEPAQPPKQQVLAFESAIKNYVHPHFPRLAVRRGITGTVKIALVVQGSGKVKEVLLTQSSGHDLLDNSALEAAKQWVFKQLSENQKQLYNISKTLVFRLN